MSGEVPMYLFILMGIIDFILLFLTLNIKYPANAITGILAIMLSYFLSKVAINGNLVNTFAGVTTGDAITTGNYIIQNASMGWIFMFLALISAILVIKIVFNEINYQLVSELEAEV